MQILERHAESRAEGQDRSRLEQRGERVRGLRLGRVHKDPEEYKRRVHSAERSMPQDMEHNSDGGCSVFGEAECYAAVKGAAEGMAVQSMLAGLGLKVTIEVHTDSSACRGICNRHGLGRLRHLDVALPWLQQRVQSGKIILRRIAGSVNPADLFTKHLARAEIIMHSGRLGFCTVSGRTTQVDTAHVELWRPECCSSTRPRGSVCRRDTIQVETHCRSSWKGSAQAPSDDPCSG